MLYSGEMKRWVWALALPCLAGCGGEEPDPTESVQAAVKVCADGNTIEGVDVSHYDGDIDWALVKADGIEFAVAKASESITNLDPTFGTNRQNAKAMGVAFGAYHFFRADDDPVVQANHFLDAIGSVEDGEISPVLDLETADGQSASTIVSSALTFLEVLETETGRVPIIYTSPSFFTSTLGSPPELAGYPLWIAKLGYELSNGAGCLDRLEPLAIHGFRNRQRDRHPFRSRSVRRNRRRASVCGCDLRHRVCGRCLPTDGHRGCRWRHGRRRDDWRYRRRRWRSGRTADERDEDLLFRRRWVRLPHDEESERSARRDPVPVRGAQPSFSEATATYSAPFGLRRL